MFKAFRVFQAFRVFRGEGLGFRGGYIRYLRYVKPSVGPPQRASARTPRQNRKPPRLSSTEVGFCRV